MAGLCIFGHVLCTQKWGRDGSLSQERPFDGARLGGHKIRRSCCFNSARSSLPLPLPSSPWLSLKKVGSHCDPNQDHKRGPICWIAVPCQSSVCSDCISLSCAQLTAARRGPHNTHGATQLARRLFLNASAQPSPRPVHKSQHDVYTTKLLCGLCPSQNTLVQSPLVRMFSWHGQIQTDSA